MKDGSFDAQLFKYLTNSTTYYTIRMDLEGRYTYVNPFFQQKFAYLTSNFIGVPFESTIHAGDVERCNQAALACITEPGKIVKISVRKWGPDGEFYWTAWEFMALTDEQGQPVELLCIGHDITEEVKAEKGLARTSYKMDVILDSITDGFFMIDRNWRLVRVNRRFEQLLNVRREEQIGRNIWELYPDAVHLRFYPEAHRAMRERKVAHFEEFYPAYNTWFAVAGYPSEEGLTVYMRDITEKKKQENQLRESLHKLKAVLDSTTDVHFFMNADYTILSHNRKATHYARLLFNRELREGDRIFDYISPGETEWFKILFQRALNGETIEVEHQMHYQKSVSLWLRIDLSPVQDDEGRIIGVSLNMVDINDQKKAEIKIREQNERLLEITRMQSHDLRRPVANILGLTDLLDDDQPDGQLDRMIIANLRITAGELDAIIHRILSLTQDL